MIVFLLFFISSFTIKSFEKLNLSRSKLPGPYSIIFESFSDEDEKTTRLDDSFDLLVVIESGIESLVVYIFLFLKMWSNKNKLQFIKFEVSFESTWVKLVSSPKREKTVCILSLNCVCTLGRKSFLFLECSEHQEFFFVGRLGA